MTVSPTSLNIINIVPYNQFLLNCMAAAYVEGQSVPLDINVLWTHQQDGFKETNVLPSDFESSESPDMGYQSRLRGNGSIVVRVTYHCIASLNIMSNIQESNQSVITVYGK